MTATQEAPERMLWGMPLSGVPIISVRTACELVSRSSSLVRSAAACPAMGAESIASPHKMVVIRFIDVNLSVYGLEIWARWPRATPYRAGTATIARMDGLPRELHVLPVTVA